MENGFKSKPRKQQYRKKQRKSHNFTSNHSKSFNSHISLLNPAPNAFMSCKTNMKIIKYVGLDSAPALHVKVRRVIVDLVTIPSYSPPVSSLKCGDTVLPVVQHEQSYVQSDLR